MIYTRATPEGLSTPELIRTTAALGITPVMRGIFHVGEGPDTQMLMIRWLDGRKDKGTDVPEVFCDRADKYTDTSHFLADRFKDRHEIVADPSAIEYLDIFSANDRVSGAGRIRRQSLTYEELDAYYDDDSGFYVLEDEAPRQQAHFAVSARIPDSIELDRLNTTHDREFHLVPLVDVALKAVGVLSEDDRAFRQLNAEFLVNALNKLSE